MDVMDIDCVQSDPGADMLQTRRVYALAALDALARRRPCAGDTVARRAASFDEEGVPDGDR
jgi:hypothetical protein